MGWNYIKDLQERSKLEKLNVICIMMDTWRFDYLGCHPSWNGWVKTPRADKLASEGTLFENAYAEGVPTLPARMALFTGRYTFPYRPWQRLENNDLLLSDVLDRAGYKTALISDHLRHTNYMMGFRYVEFGDNFALDTRPPGSPRAQVDIDRYYKDRGDHRDAFNRERLKRELEVALLWENDEGSYAAQTAKKAMKWLEQQSEGEPFFLWFDTWDPHEAWDPPPPFDTMYLDPSYEGPLLPAPSGGSVSGYLTDDEVQCVRALYGGEVSMCDKWLGILLDKVEELGFLENTLIIFLSDHGNHHGEHDLVRKVRDWPQEEMSHIPLIIRHPEGIGKDKRIQSFVDTTDIMPTILDFLGIKLPPPRSSHEMLHGHSLLPLLTGEADKVREYAYMGWFNRSWAIRDGDWKYIMYGPNFVYTGKDKNELFNLREDPEELDNLYDEEHELVDSLELELRRFVHSLPRPHPPKPIEKWMRLEQPAR